MERLIQSKGHLHGDWKSGLLDKAEYQFMTEDCQQKITALEEQLKVRGKDKAEYIAACTSGNPAVASLSAVSPQEFLTSEIITLLVERIEVYEDQRIRIYLKFEDELRAIIDYINKNELKTKDCIA